MSPDLDYTTFEDLLDKLRGEGVESEGVFTLNPARARDLLKQFQLPEPAQYVLHIISFLVGAGASNIQLFNERSLLRIEAKGAQIDEPTLKSPFSVLMSRSASVHLRELALGLNALLGQPKAEASFESGGFRATYKPDTIQMEECAQNETLSIRLKPRLSTASGERETELVRNFFGFCHVPIIIDGEPLSGPSAPTDTEGLEIHLANDNYPIALNSQGKNRITKAVTAPFSALLHINRALSGFRVVHLGRTYTLPKPWSIGLPSWQIFAVVNCDKFQKDLSQQAILIDTRCQNLAASLRVQVEQALDTLLSVVPPMPGSDALVDDLVANRFKKNPEKAIEFQQKIAGEFALKTDCLEKGKALYRLALMQSMVGGYENSSPRQSHAQLSSVQCSQPLEPRWSVLNAELDFAPRSHTLSVKCQDFLRHDGLTAQQREKCCRWLSEDKGLDPTTTAWYSVEFASVLLKQGRLTEASSALRKAEALVRYPGFRRSDEFEVLLSETRGELAVHSGHLEEAVRQFGIQLASLSKRHGQHSLKLGLTLERLVYLLKKLGQKKQAREYQAWSQRLH